MDRLVWTQIILMLFKILFPRPTDLLRLLRGPHLDDAHVPVDLGLDHALDLAVELHEAHVADVAQQQHQALPPQDGVVQEEDDEHDEVQDVEGHVSEERPPGQVQYLPGEDGAHADHKQDVEDGRAHDGADAHVAVGDEDSDQGGEELRGGASGRHEGGPGHVVGDRQLGGDDLQPGDEELVTDDGQGDEHVDHA